MDYTNPKLWFSWEGRINRRPYFFAGLLAGGLVEAGKIVPPALTLIYVPIVLVAVYVGICLGIKRCHDRGRAGWFMLVNFVPILNLWPLIELTFFKGDEGPNAYGADPLAVPPPQPPA